MNCKICNSQNNFIRKGRKVCTICENKQRKDRYNKNHDNELSRRREYKDQNPTKIKEQKKEYKQTEKYKVYTKAYVKNKYENDANYREIKMYRRKLNKFIKNELITFSEIDCSYENLKKWLEFNFDNNMSWNNYGTYWNIDHTLPLTEIREDLISWKNLFPMEKEENSKKNNKIIDSIIIYREQQLIKYLKNNE